MVFVCFIPFLLGPIAILFGLAMRASNRIARYRFLPYILFAAAFGYFVFWGNSYWYMEGSTRIRLFILIPSAVVLIVFGGAIFKWRLIRFWTGFGLYLLFVYLLVCGFVGINMQQFLLCHFEYDHIEWTIEETIAWPYMLVKGEKLPDEPCYWG